MDSAVPAPPVHPILFDCTDGSLIHNVALRVTSAAGPLGLDAAQWKSLCTGFSNPLAVYAMHLPPLLVKIAMEFVDPDRISALVVYRLTPLN